MRTSAASAERGSAAYMPANDRRGMIYCDARGAVRCSSRQPARETIQRRHDEIQTKRGWHGTQRVTLLGIRADGAGERAGAVSLQ